MKSSILKRNKLKVFLLFIISFLFLSIIHIGLEKYYYEKSINEIVTKNQFETKKEKEMVLKLNEKYKKHISSIFNDKIIHILSIIFLLSAVLSFFIIKFFSKTLFNLNEMKALNKKLIKQTKKLNKLKANLEDEVAKQTTINTKQQILLFEHSKNAALGGMIGNIAHQWKQPLSIISTITSSLQFKYQMDLQINKDEVIEDMEDILIKIDYLNENINTFRNYLKQEKKYKRTNIKDELEKAIKICDVMLKDNNIKLIENYKNQEDIYLMLVNGELTEVLINIINNAKDALKEKFIKEPFIDVSLIKDKQKVQITIEDNAKGIDEEILPDIFKQYFSTKPEHQGTGLGLFMSKVIVQESLNGKIDVKNTSNGAKFIIELDL